jgi:hypothetical protein
LNLRGGMADPGRRGVWQTDGKGLPVQYRRGVHVYGMMEDTEGSIILHPTMKKPRSLTCQ